MARFWEALGPPKIEKNQKKSIFYRVQFRRRVLGGFWEGLGRVLGGFGEEFGRVLGRFGKGFGSVLGWFWEGLEGFFRSFLRSLRHVLIDNFFNRFLQLLSFSWRDFNFSSIWEGWEK